VTTQVRITPKEGTVTDSPERLLTTPEVADLFRVGTATILRWTKRGRIPHIVTPGGREKRYPQSAVHAILQSWRAETEGGDQ